MTETSVLWLRVAAILYSLGLASSILMLTRKRLRLFRAALTAFSLGALFHLVAIIEQGLDLGALPVRWVFESVSLGAVLITDVVLLFCGLYRAARLRAL